MEPIRGTDSKIDQKLLPRADSDQKASTPISILLLYRRDDAQVSLRTSQLRKRLQSEYGSRIQVKLFSYSFHWPSENDIQYCLILSFRFLIMVMKLNGKTLLLRDQTGCQGVFTEAVQQPVSGLESLSYTAQPKSVRNRNIT